MNDSIFWILLALACTAIAYAFGWRRGRRELWAEACAASRYRKACNEVLRWCGREQHRAARLVASHVLAHGEGEIVNAGTPCGDEPCTVSGLRVQLSRLGGVNHG